MMSKGKYTSEFKNTIVDLFNSGKSLAELSREYSIAKSTIKSWVEKSKPIFIQGDKTITTEDYQKMLKEMALIKEENEILKKAMAIFTKK